MYNAIGTALLFTYGHDKLCLFIHLIDVIPSTKEHTDFFFTPLKGNEAEEIMRLVKFLFLVRIKV